MGFDATNYVIESGAVQRPSLIRFRRSLFSLLWRRFCRAITGCEDAMIVCFVEVVVGLFDV